MHGCLTKTEHNLWKASNFQEAHLVIGVVLTCSGLPDTFYLWITFDLASSFTLDFVVDCLVNPRVYDNICFHQRYLRTIILQSLGFKSCIHCDSDTSHLYQYAKANHKNLLIQWHIPSYYPIFFFLCIVGMNRISGLQGLLSHQATLRSKLVWKILFQSNWLLTIIRWYYILLHVIISDGQIFFISRKCYSKNTSILWYIKFQTKPHC